MKTNYLSIRAAVTAIGALCCAIVLPSISHAAGGLSVNGQNVCGSGTNMNLNPAGDIVVQCIPPNTGPATSPPSCTVTVSPASIGAGSSSSITAACTPAATSWLWSVTAGGPAMSGPSASLVFPTPGTYVYTVTPSNAAGSGAPAAGSVIVTGGPPTTGDCTPISTSGAFAANGVKLISIDRGAKVSYALPVYGTPGKTLEILSIQSTASQSDLTSEFSVSTCPGDFDRVPAECKTWGTVNQSGTQLYASTNGFPLAGTCTVITGQQYYINVRNTQFDRVTPACTQANTCYMNLQLNSY
jgi:hypothetical protein